MTIDDALNFVRDELLVAESKFPPFNNAHEGYAVILEELDELWDEVKKHQQRRDYESMGQEAIQVAAMAVRFLRDVVEARDVGAVARTDGVVTG